ncbi:MAG: aminopeptidase N [Burkholderiales bacterium]|nr:aminopeptidase N [Burkholderiales bacterium]
MAESGNAVVRRGDYRAPGFWLDRVELVFDLDPLATVVTSTLSLRRNAATHADGRLTLFGDGLPIEAMALNGVSLPETSFRQQPGRIEIDAATLTAQGDCATLTLVTRFNPTANLALEGLYITGGTFCTQCEAEGFRRITWFPDRPDVLSEYFVTIRADKAAFPVLLSNGNLLGIRDLADGRHEARWHDPHKKPCYLFALVAGDLDRMQDEFVTASGRRVRLEIYSTTANLPRCRWAMDCLKAAMRWDEQAYGREFDLDRFMIYAADDFNMGAMENKGLNIFNSRFLLADQHTATDADFQTVDAIVAHEYFHNWSGNRVTCRDWFQLSLKEGFTVFREQQYTATRAAPAVVRIEEAAFMQQRQFAQDAGPMAHPIRPDEYEAIDNFYTVTVYEKGAEVIRMLRALLGADTYRRGCDLYFERHDGTAATCDDFVAAMEAASGRDLSQFKRWYSQAGTPTLRVRDDYDAAQNRYSLHVVQHVPPTPGQPHKQPMVIPLAAALLHEDGRIDHEGVLEVTAAEQRFEFDRVAAHPIPSLLRGFSAPVRVRFDYSDAQLIALASRDNDGVSRWQAMRELFFRAFDGRAAQARQEPGGGALRVDPAMDRAVAALLADHHSDPALLAHLLILPSYAELADRTAADQPIDPLAIADARDDVLRALIASQRAAIIERYGRERATLRGQPWAHTLAQVAHRALSNTLLALANVEANRDAQEFCLAQADAADNLTDVIGAMTALRDQPGAVRDVLYRRFHDAWQDDLSMLNRWFSLEAATVRGDAAAHASALLAHPKFDGKNPNRVRAVVQAFGDQNWRGFHATDGSGYHFIADQIRHYDAQNPSLAARFCDVFARWHRCAEPARTQQGAQLQRIVATETLSANVREIIEKTLKSGS